MMVENFCIEALFRKSLIRFTSSGREEGHRAIKLPHSFLQVPECYSFLHVPVLFIWQVEHLKAQSRWLNQFSWHLTITVDTISRSWKFIKSCCAIKELFQQLNVTSSHLLTWATFESEGDLGTYIWKWMPECPHQLPERGKVSFQKMFLFLVRSKIWTVYTVI